MIRATDKLHPLHVYTKCYLLQSVSPTTNMIMIVLNYYTVGSALTSSQNSDSEVFCKISFTTTTFLRLSLSRRTTHKMGKTVGGTVQDKKALSLYLHTLNCVPLC